MREMVCIVCPKGCILKSEKRDGALFITGNACKRGERFALTEFTKPMRTISSTVKTAFKEVPVLPVRVSAEIPKDRIFDVMAEINKVVIDKACRRDDIIIKDVLGLGVDVIATSDILKNPSDWK